MGTDIRTDFRTPGPAGRIQGASNNRDSNIMAKIAFLGLGVMGYPMAGHIAAAGHEVTVYNRTAAKAEAWVAQHGGGNGDAHAATPAAAATDADVVLSCVGDE